MYVRIARLVSIEGEAEGVSEEREQRGGCAEGGGVPTPEHCVELESTARAREDCCSRTDYEKVGAAEEAEDRDREKIQKTERKIH